MPAVTPLQPWEWTQRPWSRVHMDHAGPFCGKMFLIIVDAYSKWTDAKVASSTTSYTTKTFCYTWTTSSHSI